MTLTVTLNMSPNFGLIEVCWDGLWTLFFGLLQFRGHSIWLICNGRGKPTASSLLADGFPLMAGLNFQPSDGNPTVISILRQLADGPKNVPEM